jgi:hypothetical protein
VGVPFETLSAKPVALAPVGATVKAGVHTFPFLATKRGVSLPTHGEEIPPKKTKRRVLPRLFVVALCFGQAFYLADTGCFALLALPLGLFSAGSASGSPLALSAGSVVVASPFASLSALACSLALSVSIGITTS